MLHAHRDEGANTQMPDGADELTKLAWQFELALSVSDGRHLDASKAGKVQGVIAAIRAHTAEIPTVGHLEAWLGMLPPRDTEAVGFGAAALSKSSRHAVQAALHAIRRSVEDLERVANLSNLWQTCSREAGLAPWGELLGRQLVEACLRLWGRGGVGFELQDINTIQAGRDDPGVIQRLLGRRYIEGARHFKLCCRRHDVLIARVEERSLH